MNTAIEPHLKLHAGDLPAEVRITGAVAIDTETTGLNHHRDRLCLVQLSAGDGVCHLVHFPPSMRRPVDDGGYPCPNLRSLLADTSVTKIFHFARFDLAMIERYLGVTATPVYCTRTASKLVRTYTDRHGLKDLCREILGVDISKDQQTTDWGQEVLVPEQLRYAATDVLYLHRLRDHLDAMLVREGRADLAEACFGFLPYRSRLDLAGWAEQDIFAHS